MTISLARFHSEWPRLIDTSGTFLTLPVLKRAFPDGLEPAQRDDVAALREEIALMRAEPERQRSFVHFVLADLLNYRQVLREGQAIPLQLTHTVAEQGVTLRPDAAVVDPRVDQPTARLLVMVWPLGTDLMRKATVDRWTASPVDRMALLLRSTGTARLGLVTDGMRWVLVSTVTPVTSTAVFDVDIWLEERVTLDAFVTLLSARRLFGVAERDRLEALLTESSGAQEEVTGKLGEQVRQAVEILVGAFSRADREVGGRLLAEVCGDDLYGAAVTVMMRLVFILYAESRRLFPLDDDLYETSYAVTSLLDQLEEVARGEIEVLDRRSAAWSRLLALFRAIHEGVQHVDLRMQAYGGSLFDPDRYAFLEGRPTAATPLHQALPIKVTDLEVRDVLQALLVLRFTDRGVSEARRLSYRNLDVEQIGHVYEGLLDHGARRVDDVHLGLRGKLEPEIALAELEERRSRGEAAFRAWVAEVAGRTPKQVDKDLDALHDELALRHLRAACDGDDALAVRITPFLGLTRPGARDLPTLFLPGSVYVTKSSERRSSGTYYTPRSLAEEMVQHALEPLVYSPGPQDTADRAEWKLRPAAEILDLKVCDMTMGSGAFLVAACRFLADRLLETTAAGGDGRRKEREDDEDELVEARRLVVERCLYGVDRNPMAVEMAKLSMWLVTLAKDRPFTFLDGQFVCGDSLVGISSLDQITAFHLDPARGRELHEGRLFDDLAALREVVADAVKLRDQLTAIRVLDVRDAERKQDLLAQYRKAVEPVAAVADLIVGAAMSTAGRRGSLDDRLVAIAPELDAALSQVDEGGHVGAIDVLRARSYAWLNDARPRAAPQRVPLHWAVEFPEVFSSGHAGFDAIVGNPPFSGGKRITGSLGTDYREFLVLDIARGQQGSADLVTYFVLRGARLTAPLGQVAFIATNTVAQGDSREVGLDRLLASGWHVYRAVKTRPWPGTAAVEVAQLWLSCCVWATPPLLDGRGVAGISSSLDPQSRVSGTPRRLRSMQNRAFIGSYLWGRGFVVSQSEAAGLLDRDARNRDVLFPYLTGDDLNSSPTQEPSAWVINFFDWSLEHASEYPECLAIVRERVKPVRDEVKRPAYRERWWQFAEKAVALYAATADHPSLIAMTAISNTLMPALVRGDVVVNHKVIAYADFGYSTLGFLSSSIHREWAIARSSTLGSGVNYSPSDCFETLPLPPGFSSELESLGERYHAARRSVLIERSEGLTKLAAQIHSAAETSEDIVMLRDAQNAIDAAVLSCYGWHDLELHHGFHDTVHGVRYAVDPAERVEILDRLLELNQALAARQEAKQPQSKHRRRSSRLGRNGAADEPPTLGVEGTLPLDIEGELPLGHWGMQR